MFLTPAELITLTGYRRASAQVRWLQLQGVPHWVRADGRPSVPRSAIEAQPVAQQRPNWSALERRR